MSTRKSLWKPKLTKKKIVVFQDLDAFLADPGNTTSREVMMRWRLLYELSVAAAQGGIALQSFLPDVDREGFDVVLSDHDETRPMQLKVTRARVTPGFQIDGVHCTTLRPRMDVAESIGFSPGQCGTGQHGCLVLTEITELAPDEPRIEVRYWITDPFILAALRHPDGLVPGAPAVAHEDATALIYALHQGASHDRVSVRGSCFVPAASPSALLALMGLHSSLQLNAWQNNLIERTRMLTAEDLEVRKRKDEAVPGASGSLDGAHAEQVRSAFRTTLAWPKQYEKPA